MKYTKEEKENTKKDLLLLLKPQDTVIYYFVTSVASSGMSRWIRFIISDEKNSVLDIGFEMAKLLDERYDYHKGIFLSGCGMDIGFNAIYNIGNILWPKGDGKTIIGRNGDTKPETDGGYLLKYHQL